MEPATPASTQPDLRPVVGQPVSNRNAWLFGGVLVLAAVGLFTALEARRSAVISPATAPSRTTGSGVITAPPPLVLNDPAVPIGLGGTDYLNGPRLPQTGLAPGANYPVMPGVPRTPRVAQSAVIPGPPIVRPPVYYAPGGSDEPYRASTVPQPLPIDPGTGAAVPGQLAGDRARASRFANPAYTVPQGTVVQAVLETALDSNRPGFVRAIVSRDVRSFDGTRVLIPRGSRLFGEYKADLAQGQKRVFVQWQKLTRPDGVQIALDSPAADPLGRAGIGGRVNTHFFSRLGNALLQSTLDIGVGLATRGAGGDTVVLGLPGSTQTLIQPNQESYKPTVTVKHGTSVAVFVARDLDFSTVE
jgi:type IV secretion system protein VirB10